MLVALGPNADLHEQARTRGIARERHDLCACAVMVAGQPRERVVQGRPAFQLAVEIELEELVRIGQVDAQPISLDPELIVSPVGRRGVLAVGHQSGGKELALDGAVGGVLPYEVRDPHAVEPHTQAIHVARAINGDLTEVERVRHPLPA